MRNAFYHDRPLFIGNTGGNIINREETTEFAEKFLAAWNSQDVNSVLNCYTEDCIYLDPNTQGSVNGHDSLRKYLMNSNKIESHNTKFIITP